MWWTLMCAAALAQDPLVQERWEARHRTQVVGMSTLLGWSAANLGVGAVGWGVAREPEWVAFHQMTVAWSGVNLAIAVPGLVGALRERPDPDLSTALRRTTALRTTFALNTGLDVGWVLLGAWMNEAGLRREDARLTGFGRSVMMQGGFLLVFDAAMLITHARGANGLLVHPLLGTPGVQVTWTPQVRPPPFAYDHP